MKGPDQICIVTNVTCNLSCLNCDAWKSEPRKPMSKRQIRNLLARLRSWLGPIRPDGSRPFEVYFAGGEPFMRKDMEEILSCCRDLGIWCQVTTNGTLLTEKRAEKVIRAEPGAIGISIDAARPEIHDYLRGKEGAFENAWAAVRRLGRLKLERNASTAVQVHALLSGFHPQEVLDLVDMTARTRGVLNLIIQALVAPCFSEVKTGWWKNNPFWPRDMDLMNRVIDELIQKKRKYESEGRPVLGNSEAQLELIRLYFTDPARRVPGRCTVGGHSFNVDVNGDVRICHFMEPVGNILKQDPEKIWLSKAAAKVRKKIESCVSNCNLMNCNWFEDGLEGVDAVLAGLKRS
ncbi:MAG: radical SAM protein [Deltaproteobacteria bacterium]|nr:radical SAM protein [Deltaproteobacteria bacterium]